MMMSLGEFVFGLPSWAYQDFARDADYRHASAGRVLARDATQFLGESETIQLSGELFPDIAGDAGSFATLREMAGKGEAWPLVTGAGEVLGNFVITSARERQENFLDRGEARKYDFQISLLRVDDTPQAQGDGAREPAT